jgi:hypothetical protein
VPLSALHGRGSGDFLDQLVARYRASSEMPRRRGDRWR